MVAATAMKGWRFRTPNAVRLALCLFIASVAAPRPGLFFHVHVDGDHIHVHDDSPADDGLDDGDHRSLHPHHPDGGAVADHDAKIEAPEPAHLGHWHWQNRFHRVAPAALIPLIRSEFVQPIPLAGRSDCPIGSLFSAHARAPPSLTAC